MNNPLGLSLKVSPVEYEDQTYYVRAITARERIEISKNIEDADYAGRLLSVALCHSDGTRMFGESDIESLMDVPSAFAEAITSKWLDINGLRKANADAKQKNS